MAWRWKVEGTILSKGWTDGKKYWLKTFDKAKKKDSTPCSPSYKWILQVWSGKNQSTRFKQTTAKETRARKQETTLSPIASSCSTKSLLTHFKSHFNPPDLAATGTPKELTGDDLPVSYLIFSEYLNQYLSMMILQTSRRYNHTYKNLKSIKLSMTLMPIYLND